MVTSRTCWSHKNNSDSCHVHVREENNTWARGLLSRPLKRLFWSLCLRSNRIDGVFTSAHERYDVSYRWHVPDPQMDQTKSNIAEMQAIATAGMRMGGELQGTKRKCLAWSTLLSRRFRMLKSSSKNDVSWIILIHPSSSSRTKLLLCLSNYVGSILLPGSPSSVSSSSFVSQLLLP